MNILNRQLWQVILTYQLTALKPQPQLSQKQIVKTTASNSLVHCIMHPPAQPVELLLTNQTIHLGPKVVAIPNDPSQGPKA